MLGEGLRFGFTISQHNHLVQSQWLLFDPQFEIIDLILGSILGIARVNSMECWRGDNDDYCEARALRMKNEQAKELMALTDSSQPSELREAA